jgi:hypothetical protein
MLMLPFSETRRNLLLSTLLLWHDSSACNSSPLLTISLDQWSALICEFTPRVLRQAVQQSGGRFLYRGADDATIQRRIDHPDPDLLVPGTYDDPDALPYFQCLERQLYLQQQPQQQQSQQQTDAKEILALPSTGHVATSDAKEASAWGSVVSVWPLGSEFSFVWPKERNDIFPGGTCPDKTLVVDRQLDLALALNREVLFASSFPRGVENPQRGIPISVASRSAYIMIPMEEDQELRRRLEERNYGL